MAVGIVMHNHQPSFIPMIYIELIETGEIVEVTRNVGHTLIDSGKGRLVNRGYKVKPLLPTFPKEGAINLPSRSRGKFKPGYTTK